MSWAQTLAAKMGLRLCPSFFKKHRLEVMSAAGHKSVLLRKNRVPTLMLVKKFLQTWGIRVVQRDLRGKRHFLLRGADGCIGAQTWSFIDLAA